MRGFLAIFLLFISFIAANPVQAQLSGAYVNHSSWTGYEKITFKANNKFSYDYADCTGDRSGSGTYRIKNGKLTLTFEVLLSPSLENAVSIDTLQLVNDSSYIQVNVYDIDSGNLKNYANVLYKHSKDPVQYNNLTASGQAILSFPADTNSNILIGLKESGTEALEVWLPLTNSYNIEAYLKFIMAGGFINGEQRVYTIKRIGSKILLLKLKARYTTKFERYNRI